MFVMIKRSITFMLVGILFFGLLQVIPSTHRLIPRDILFGNHARKFGLRLSRQGDMLAYLAPVDTVINIWVRSIDKEDDRPITHDTDRGIHGYYWSVDGTRIFYVQDQAGNENWRLYSVSIDDGKIQEYTPFDNVQVRLIKYTKEFPDRMILGINKRDPKAHDVYELNIATGELRLIEENSGAVIVWCADVNLNILGKVELIEEGGYKLFVRSSINDPWREFGTWLSTDGGLYNIYFSKDGKYLFMSDARFSNTSRFVKIDLATDQSIELVSDPDYDVIADILSDLETDEPLAIHYVRDKPTWKFLDENITKIFSDLSTIDEGEINIVSRNYDDSLWIVVYEKDNGPLAYWLYNTKTQEKKFLFYHQPIYNEYELAHMEPIQFHARDGLLIHGYLIYPCGMERKNLPLIVNVHGGPWLRDTWGLDSEVQWMANRGYAVLQINYRASIGYGKEFRNAGNKQWGKAMQNDITDGVYWAIEQGIADPKRVAIYGGSYGGYAALAGATFTPDLYRCAVDIVGISNLFSFIETIPPYWTMFLSRIKIQIGDPVKDKELLYSASPLFHIDAIKIPILIAQGANDPRVKQSESEQIVAALKVKGLEYEYILFPDEGHGFAKQENRLKFYKVAENFLAKYLGGNYEA